MPTTKKNSAINPSFTHSCSVSSRWNPPALMPSSVFQNDSYECAATDWASLVVLAMAKAKEATGTAMRDNVRKISQGSGTKVSSAVEGLKLLAQGKEINYDGASGPCDFNEIGDILDCRFRYSRIVKQKITFLKVI